MSAESKVIKLAVMSDLHCHHSKNFKKGDKTSPSSYLTTDKLRSPARNHPVQSLLELVANGRTISADYLLCPGDITDKVDAQGFISGWDYMKEVGDALNVEQIIATLGNHDVDSRYNMSDDVFELAKGIGKNFPINDADLRDKFWSNGFCFFEAKDIRILIINSVRFHTKEDLAVQGKVNDTQLESIDKYLKEHIDDKVKVALCHHHPIDHSRWNLGTEDVIEQGSQLIEILNNNSFDLLIHGHKHDPWLRYAPGNHNAIPIFSSGSFSSMSNILVTGSRNTFHIIEIKKKGTSRANGIINTWEFLPNNGWRPADSGEIYFPVLAGFGYQGRIDTLVEKTVKEIGGKDFISWDELLSKIEDIQYLTPDECFEYKRQLDALSIITNPELPKRPKIIGRLHKS